MDKHQNTLVAPNMLSFEEVNNKIWDLEAEILVPAAASRLLKEDQVERLIAGGLEVISCGANVPFADQKSLSGLLLIMLTTK